LLEGFLDEDLDEALEDDLTDVSADDFLPLPLLFFFGLLFFFFCTFEGAATGLVAVAAGRLPGFAFLVFPPATFVGRGGGAIAGTGTSPVLEALERVVGAMLLFCWRNMQSKISSRR
jgi:hypothetical protein